MKTTFSVSILCLMGALIAAPIWAAEQSVEKSAEQSAEKPAEHSAEDLAKAAQNPIAHMISLPFQENVNFNVGPENKAQNVLNIQPVIPVSLTPDWNLITRTIVPIISQPPFGPGQETEFGLGDIQFQAFFSPAKTEGLIWGVGPIAQLPAHTNDRMGSPIWGLGPTAVALRIDGPWVYGAVVNNLWSLGGSDKTKYNNFLLQPFINYNFGKTGTYLVTSPIITANWRTGDWVVPLGGGIGQIFKMFGKQAVNAQLQAFYNVAHPDGLGPEWSIRLQVVLLFPK